MLLKVSNKLTIIDGGSKKEPLFLNINQAPEQKVWSPLICVLFGVIFYHSTNLKLSANRELVEQNIFTAFEQVGTKKKKK